MWGAVGAWVRSGALVGLVGIVGCASGPGPGDPDRTPFDYDWSVVRLGGGEVELGALRGRVLVINFWATWCPPCVAELDSFQRLMGAVEDAGVEATFLFVTAEEAGVVEPFVTRHGWRLPFALERRRAPASLGDLVLPTTFVVDRGGRVVLRHRGATAWDQPDVVELLAALDREERPPVGRREGAS